MQGSLGYIAEMWVSKPGLLDYIAETRVSRRGLLDYNKDSMKKEP